MEKNLQNIEDLFNKAKTAEPVIDSKFARNVINKRALLASDMFHITKGVKIMNLISSIALVSAAASIISLTNSNEQKAQNYINESKTALVQTAENIKPAKLEELDIAADKPQVIKQTIKVSNDEQKQNVKEKIFDNKLDIDGINPITLEHDELLNLGVQVTEDCYSIMFIDKFPKMEKVCTVSQDGAFLSEDLNSESIKKYGIDSKFESKIPRLITDAEGTKMFSSFGDGQNIRGYISEVKDTSGVDIPQMINFGINIPIDSIIMAAKNIKMPDSLLINIDAEKINSTRIIRTELRSRLLNDQKLINDTGEIKINNNDISFSEFVKIDADNVVVNSKDNSKVISLSIPNMKFPNSNNDEIKISLYPDININELLPVKIILRDKNTGEMNKEMIIWFEATNEVLAKLPETIKRKLSPEFEAMADNEETCPKPPVTGEKPYFDIWRACSGAIEQLKTYPTPAKENLNYKFNLDQDRELSIYVCNLSGEIVSNPVENQQYKVGSYENKININDLKPGMYLLVVSSDIGEKAVQRFVVL